MEFLNSMGKVKPLVAMNSLELNKRYPIVKAVQCHTKFGPRLLVELESCKVFLPVRFNGLNEDMLKQLSSTEMVVVQPCGNSFELKFYRVLENDEECFEVVDDNSTFVMRFHLRGRRLQFRIKNIPEDVEPKNWMQAAVKGIIKYVTDDMDSSDMVEITLTGKNFEQRGPGWMSYRKAVDLKWNEVWELLQQIFQSDFERLCMDTFRINVTSVPLPKGQGNERTNKYNSFDEECAKRRGIIVIKKKDKLCLPRALVVAIALVDNDPEYIKIRNNTGRLQDLRTENLISTVGASIPSEGCGIPEIRIFQNHLREYNIIVYEYGQRTKGRNIIFEGNNKNISKRLNLLYFKGHFNVINSMKGKYRCVKSRPQCQQSLKCPKTPSKMICQYCNRHFRGQECFDNHKASTSTGSRASCQAIIMCVDCLYHSNQKRQRMLPLDNQ